MNFVFYDLETTGTNIDFDQALQIGAVLTDDNLNELDSLNLRCRRLPWVVPSPQALLVTRITPSQLEDRSLRSHYEMFREAAEVLRSWSPAIYVGYNSAQFDEEFLRRGLWQTLQFPWLTVSNGNGRLDLLQVVRILSVANASVLRWPKHPDGSASLRLDMLGPANGHDNPEHHDALGDALATVHLARLIAKRSPDLWRTFLKRTSRRPIEEEWSRRHPLIMMDYSPQPGLRFRQFVGNDPVRKGASLLARLDTDWEALSQRPHSDVRAAFERPQMPLLPIRSTRAPVFLTADEGVDLAITPSPAAARQSAFLRDNSRALRRVLEVWTLIPPRLRSAEHLEQQLYEGFPSAADQKNADTFHSSSGRSRVAAARAFKDERLARWAQRVIYDNNPQDLLPAELKSIEAAIADRLLASNDSETSEWRTLASALQELRKLPNHDPLIADVRMFLTNLRSDWELRRRSS